MKPPLPYSKNAQSFRLGVYEHYKGPRYKVIAVARHTETLEELVVYHPLQGAQDIWVRPLQMFLETVFIEEKGPLPRFRWISP